MQQLDDQFWQRVLSEKPGHYLVKSYQFVFDNTLLNRKDRKKDWDSLKASWLARVDKKDVGSAMWFLYCFPDDPRAKEVQARLFSMMSAKTAPSALPPGDVFIKMAHSPQDLYYSYNVEPGVSFLPEEDLHDRLHKLFAFCGLTYARNGSNFDFLFDYWDRANGRTYSRLKRWLLNRSQYILVFLMTHNERTEQSTNGR